MVMFLCFLVSYFSEADQIVVTKYSESKTTNTNISDIPRFYYTFVDLVKAQLIVLTQ